jgi:hypothetical protein
VSGRPRLGPTPRRLCPSTRCPCSRRDESALEDDPQLAGELVTDFTIVGAEDVGGIVEDATVSDDSTLDSAFVRECMHESLMP